jgi:hypothetical protein
LELFVGCAQNSKTVAPEEKVRIRFTAKVVSIGYANIGFEKTGNVISTRKRRIGW